MGKGISKRIFKGDKIIWTIFFILCALSIIEVFSASSRKTFETHNYWQPITRHAMFVIAGVGVTWFIHNMKISWIKQFSYFIYIAGVIGLVWAAFGGAVVNESARWVEIFGIKFQPMEIAKMGIVMTTALVLAESQTEEGTDLKAMKKIMLLCAVPCFFILLENLSTVAIILATVFLMMLIGRVYWKHLLGLVGAGALAVIILFGAIMATPNKIEAKQGSAVYKVHNKMLTWKNRVLDVTDTGGQVKPKDYQISGNEQRTYANIAIATSGLIGKGPGNSVQRDNIPHAYSDFIFAIIIEELGLIGGIIVIMLYLTLLYRCGSIASGCEDAYPAFLIMGMGFIIAIQAMMHMTISVGGPVTGQPLPLVSQGGTSTLINCIYIGTMLSISRYVRRLNKANKAAAADATPEENIAKTETNTTTYEEGV
ncbi:MAG: FtsW/RodA/SpoVE family cell cycle protein [Bacteroidaceae bacterium]|nr:FtsW/RodA/SpoVE family cell cycle protein [Bacteroidaceae bacterium]MBR3612925.1 FtsW/RodA/SpoVE family cell cycle protein [Bacteroidaceae bacterium]